VLRCAVTRIGSLQLNIGALDIAPPDAAGSEEGCQRVRHRGRPGCADHQVQPCPPARALSASRLPCLHAYCCIFRPFTAAVMKPVADDPDSDARLLSQRSCQCSQWAGSVCRCCHWDVIVAFRDAGPYRAFPPTPFLLSRRRWRTRRTSWRLRSVRSRTCATRPMTWCALSCWFLQPESYQKHTVLHANCWTVFSSMHRSVSAHAPAAHSQNR